MYNRPLLPLKLIFFFFTMAWFYTDPIIAQTNTIKIGILAKRGPEYCLAKWSPTAEYLTRSLPGRTFEIVPIDFDGISKKVKEGSIDFIFANSSFYVELETKYGVNRIATLKNKRLNGTYTTFGGVIFCLKQRQDIRSYKNLKDMKFMAVEETSFGGWHMAWRELNEAGIDPYKYFSKLFFGHTHDAVVYAVKNGEVDAGTVRTDTLERMQKEGKINLDDFYIFHNHGGGNVHLDFLHSTREYPEWPMAKIKHTSDTLAQQVAIKLLEMPYNSKAAIAASSSGWTIPMNYQSVHDCLKALKVSPYENFGEVTLKNVIKNFWHVLLLLTALILLLIGSVARFKRFNTIIHDTNQKLSFEIKERELLFKQIFFKNKDLKKAISEIKQLSGLLPICAHCKKIRDDKGYWNQIESYIHEHSEATFSHGICQECAKKHYPDLDIYGDKSEF